MKLFCTCLFAALFVALHSAANNNHDDLFFLETFDEEDVFTTGRWVLSTAEKYRHQAVLVKALDTAPPAFSNDKSVQLTLEMKHYGFGAKLPTEFDTANQDVVFQYEVKLEEGLACGGAYIKLLRAAPDSNGLEELNNDTPYSIMFGPDKCGNSGKLHFIVQHQNPLTKEWEEKHLNATQPVKTDQKTHLYTMHISNSDSEFELFIDGRSVKKGNLLTHMDPPLNPPSEIDDPMDVKPSDWVDNEKIPDPTAVKPADWDEEEPRKIPDLTASKPIDWDEEAPEQIRDPNVEKPLDWDDDEDGEWEAPLVPNPHCENRGCGRWTPPQVDNPAYKGKWRPPLIDNPDYKGQWMPRKIPNPKFYYEEYPAKSLAPISAVAVEVWTTSAGIAFDNFVLTNSLEAAQAFARETFAKKSEEERAASKAKNELQKIVQEREAHNEAFDSGDIKKIAQFYMQKLGEFIEENPKVLYSTVAAVFIAFILLQLAAVKQKSKEPALKESEVPKMNASARKIESTGESDPVTEGTK